jgi:hypothetical protein
MAQTSPAADVLVVVDSSGSMDEEVAAVQASLNDFAAGIQNAAVDLHLILIGTEICIPAPLGSGMCPDDETLPLFRHVQETISSNDALSKIISTYSQWSGSLRNHARTFLIVVSDDDSDMSAATFQTQFIALNPTFSNYVFHGMVQGAPACGGVTGEVYLDLIAMTDGLLSNLCVEPIDMGLIRIADAIIEGAGPNSLITTGPGVGGASRARRYDGD